MKHVLSITAITSILSLPAYATIQSGSTCDTTNLGQSDNNSTANIEATWTANQYTEPAGQYLLFSNDTITQHQTCPANYFCPGFEDETFADTSMGLESCADATGNEYPNSIQGTKSPELCYVTGTVTCNTYNPYIGGHGTATYANATATYKLYMFSGPEDFVLDTIGACDIASLTCNTGYHSIVAGVLNSYVNQNLVWIGNTDVKFRALGGVNPSNSGDSQLGDHTNLANGAWEISWQDGTKISGTSSCNTTGGDTNDYTWSNDSANWSRPSSNFDSTSTGQYCWCKMNSYQLAGSQLATDVSNSSVWVFRYGEVADPNYCAETCASSCAGAIPDRSFRSAIFGDLGANPKCVANTINIDWYNQNTVHEQNQCTYGDTITLPTTNPTRTGYTFGGWSLRQAVLPQTNQDPGNE